jgi:hypothetical protein
MGARRAVPNRFSLFASFSLFPEREKKKKRKVSEHSVNRPEIDKTKR